MNGNDATESMTFDTSISALQARLNASPFNAWLALRITHIGPTVVQFLAPWRPEFIGTARLGRVHGGVLTALVDAAAGYTLMARTGVSISSVDVRVDFHQAAGAQDFEIEGSVVKLGRKLACVDVAIFSGSRTLIASGRGTFYIPSDKSAPPSA